MYRFVLIFLFMLSGCKSTNPVDMVFDPAIKVLEVATEIVSDPTDGKAIKRAIYSEKYDDLNTKLYANSYFVRSEKSCKSPKYPTIPDKPEWECTTSNIRSHQNQCLILGAGEYACGEVVEGWIEKTGRKIYSGAAASVGCVALSNLVSSGDISYSEVVESGILGAIDNVGEQLMHDRGVLLWFAGAATRVAVLASREAAVKRCQRRIKNSCFPEPIKERISEMKAEYNSCVGDLKEFRKFI